MKKERRTQDELIRLINSMMKKGMTRKEMTRNLSWNISKLNRFMKKHGLKNYNLPRYNYKIETFSIEDEITAYIAGLFWADGHLSKSSLTITLAEKDSILIKIINEFFFGNYIAIKEDFKRKMLKINIFNKQIRLNFLTLGLANNDRGRYIPPMRKNLFRHFLRGFIDGDGHINEKYMTVSIAGRLRMLHQIGARLNSMGFEKSFAICESPKSVCSRQKNKYGTLGFFRFYQYKVYKFLYKNANYYLPRKYEELHNRFISNSYLIEHLRRRYCHLFVLKNFDFLSKKCGDRIRYAHPVLFHKNYNCTCDLDSKKDIIKRYLYKNHYSFPKVAYLLRKSRLNASEIEIYRFCKRNNLLTSKLKEDKIIEDKLLEIHNDIKFGKKTKTGIANELGVDRRRLCRKCRNLQPSNQIKMHNPEYFDRIDTTQKAFFIGFLLLRNSINRKYLHIKLREPKHCFILDKFAQQLYGRFSPKVILSERKNIYSFGSTLLVNSLKCLGIDKKSIDVKNKIDKRYHKSFALGMFCAKLTVSKLKNGHCAQISSEVETISWLQSFLEEFNIQSKKEKNNPRKLVLLQKNYEQLINHFGIELHQFHMGNFSELRFNNLLIN